MGIKPYYRKKKGNFKKPFVVIIAITAVLAAVMWYGLLTLEENDQLAEPEKVESEKEDVVIDEPEIVDEDVKRILEDPVINEIESRSAWAEVKVYSLHSGGRFFWEFSDEDILSDEIKFEEAIEGEPLGMRLEGLQPGNTYEVRPVLVIDSKRYKGDWITFTTR